jgi:two-component system, NtrC family, sensor kinase
MNIHLQHILDTLQQIENLSEEQKATITKSLKDADKELTITAFKLDRTEKVKRTTAILLEETIEELEQKRKAIEESNLALQKSLAELKAAQDQLVQQEKLASLGQLTAGIAHEIKNPLNFVNNFSDVSIEMIDEALEELKQISENEHAVETVAILTDIKANLTKIHQHGTRADGIVKSMLMHSRGGDGKLVATKLNPLIKEYVNLAFHGMRAGKNAIDVGVELQLDESIGEVPLIAEDFSRAILNLCNNAFDAMRELEAAQKQEVRSQESEVLNAIPSAELKVSNEKYLPKLTVRTYRDAEKISIQIEDNGPGISDDIKDKILQPFFTTKKGTQGTGLGLSITHDIIKAHGGSLDVLSKPGQTIFTIQLV